MTPFDRVVVVDWSARSAPSPKTPAADAIWIACANAGGLTTTYARTRAEAMGVIETILQDALARGERVLAGFDFPFGYPAGFAKALTGRPAAPAVWDWLADHIEDGADNANNRFDVAKAMNRAFPGVGPFWGCPTAVADDDLPHRGTVRTGHGMAERRLVEAQVPRAQPVWKLYTTGSVGSQALLGLPRIHLLLKRFGADIAVWPFEDPTTPLVLAEIYPSLLDDATRAMTTAMSEMTKDEAQVRTLARALKRLSPEDLQAGLTAPPLEARAEEGWILGVGIEDALRAAALPDIAPPRLKNDCFALPPGVDWVPVPQALDTLRRGMSPVTTLETLPLREAANRLLAADVKAARAHPPRANAAVDGYGFAHAALGTPPHILPLTPGAAAAGRDAGPVQAGHAIRILTGAALPPGVDTVVLEEDTTTRDGHIAFDGPVRAGANARQAGEDLVAGAPALNTGRRLTPADLGLLTATGITDVPVFRPLTVAVLSTGDELADPGAQATETTVFDANRPMLTQLLRGWHHRPHDCGIVPDDRDAVRRTLDAAAPKADAILTSGGASAGDEDHISALMTAEGTVATWRVAMKPGRPLILGLWQGVPVFGLPGNPVAAFVCAVVFARPALNVLAGGAWLAPQGFTVPAAFSKRKKAGRHEYLRARLTPDGAAEVFKSEGSGRITGISWADGLVELDAAARDIAPGDPVRYIPLTSLGIC
ncbi:MAG: gephyrin-like molybdotransferase Glp [Pseudomonadota bacterium]